MIRSAAGIYWLTGLSGSGKTTLSQAVARLLAESDLGCVVLDGDLLREGLCSDLGYSAEDRTENIRRAGEMARLMAMQDRICLCAFITPFEAMRARLRQRLGGLYHEIYISCPISVCMERDPKLNYRKARQGTLHGYTGLDAPYEPPAAPDLCVETHLHPVEDCARMIAEYVRKTCVPGSGQ